MPTTEKVDKLFAAHLKDLKAVLKEQGVDLCFDLTSELTDLEEAFTDALANIDTDISLEEAMTAIEYHKDDLCANEILPLLDDGDICDYMEEKDCLVIEVKGMTDKQKLKDFVNENIYPYCLNDRAALK